MTLTAHDLAIPAQTNGGLYQHMHLAGAPAEDIRAVQAAYGHAMQLFFGLYRGSGRPFICHLVGTASVVAQIDGRRDMIIAGMFHALFEAAVFPDGRTVKSENNRAMIEKTMGPEVFQLIRLYEQFEWSETSIASMAAQSAAPDDLARRLWILRLANEADEMSHCSFALAQKPGRAIPSRMKNCAAMARKIGEEKLAATLDYFSDEFQRQILWTKDLNLDHPSASFRLLPNVRNYFRTRRWPTHRLRVI
jgi:(p)ppGpp synthase/HD superfamily hydrolase